VNSTKSKEKILPAGGFAHVSKATGEKQAGPGEVVDIWNSLPMSDTWMCLPWLWGTVCQQHSPTAHRRQLCHLSQRKGASGKPAVGPRWSKTLCLPPSELLLAALLRSGADR